MSQNEHNPQPEMWGGGPPASSQPQDPYQSFGQPGPNSVGGEPQVPTASAGPQPGQAYPGPTQPGQAYPGQGYPDQQPQPGQAYPGPTQPGQAYPGQGYPDQQPQPGQAYPGPTYPGQAYPGQQPQSQPFSPNVPEAPQPGPGYYGQPQQMSQQPGQGYPDSTSQGMNQPYGIVPPPAPKKKTGLIVGIASAVVIALIVVIILVINPFSSDEVDSPVVAQTSSESPSTSASASATTSEPAADGKTAVGGLRPGQCVSDEYDENSTFATILDCAKPHTVEIVAKTEISEATYPTPTRLKELVEQHCVSRIKDIAGPELSSGKIKGYYIFPTRESWTSHISRNLVCHVRASSTYTITGSFVNGDAQVN